MAKEYSIGYKFKGEASGFQRTMGQMQRQLRSFAATMGIAFGVGTLVAFAKKSVEAYDAQIKAEESLKIALKGRLDIQQNLIREAGRLQRVTTFGDEETVMAMSRMAMVMGVNESAIKRLIPLVQDLAQAKFEGNLVTAADMVAKSIGSSTNALSRYGIQIEGTVGSAERLESAIKGLNNQVGGQAEAAAMVGLGPLKQLGNAFGDIVENAGKAITQTEGFYKVIYKLKAVAEDVADRGLLVALFESKEKTAARRAEIAKYDIPKEWLPYYGMGNILPDVTVTPKIKEIDTTIADLVAKIKEGAKESANMAKAWEIIHREISGGGVKGADISQYFTGTGRLAGNFKSPSTEGLRGAPVQVQELTDSLEDQMWMVNELTSTFTNMFSNIDKGVDGMVDSLIQSLRRLATELIAKAVVFGILWKLFPGLGIDISGGVGFMKGLGNFTGLGSIVPSMNTGAIGGAMKIQVEGVTKGHNIYWSNARYANVINGGT